MIYKQLKYEKNKINNDRNNRKKSNNNKMETKKQIKYQILGKTKSNHLKQETKFNETDISITNQNSYLQKKKKQKD